MKLSPIHHTLRILHALANAGVLEQRIGRDMQVRWHLKRGGERVWRQLQDELGIKDK